MEQKAHTHLSQSEGKNQSGEVKHEVFVIVDFFFDFNVVKGEKVRSRIVIIEVCFEVSQLFSVDEFEGLSPNVVKCNQLCFYIFIRILDTKGPHLSEVNEVSMAVPTFHLHSHTFGIVVEGKADLADGR